MSFTYYQQAYNEVGIQAGENTAEYIRMESGFLERRSLVLSSAAGWLN